LFDDSSQKTKELLASADVAEKIMSIGKTFGFDEFDIETISFIVREIATGKIFIGEGANIVANETELPKERAETLVSLIINEVLASAIDDIKKIQAQKPPEQVATLPKTAERPDLKIEPPVNKGNLVDLRNRQ
jgi:hypothetical protein